MLVIDKKLKNGILKLDFSGEIGEDANFSDQIGPPLPEIHINTKHVTRINSSGVKKWTEYFNLLRSKGIRIRFLECAPMIVDQMNFIFDFAKLAEIVSVCMEYRCETCKIDLLHAMLVEDLLKNSSKSDQMNCPMCSQEMELQQILDEYLSFLRG